MCTTAKMNPDYDRLLDEGTLKYVTKLVNNLHLIEDLEYLNSTEWIPSFTKRELIDSLTGLLCKHIIKVAMIKDNPVVIDDKVHRFSQPSVKETTGLQYVAHGEKVGVNSNDTLDCVTQLHLASYFQGSNQTPTECTTIVLNRLRGTTENNTRSKYTGVLYGDRYTIILRFCYYDKTYIASLNF